jgi:hypothetical protein
LKHMQEEPPPPRSLRPSIPLEVERIIGRALAKKPEERFRTAGQMAATLRSAAVNASGLVSPFENAETVVSIATVVRPAANSFMIIPSEDEEEDRIDTPEAGPIIYETPTALPIAPSLRTPAETRTVALPVEPVKGKRSLSSAVLLGVGVFLCLGIVSIGGYFVYPSLFGEMTMTPTIPIVLVGETPTATPTAQNTDSPTPEDTVTATPSVTATTTATATPGPEVSDLFFCLEPCLPNGSNAVTVAPAGVTQIFVRWTYENFPIGANYVRRWTNNGEEWVRYQCLWPGPAGNVDEVPLTEPAGLRSGEWEVTILLDEVVVAQEQLTVSGNWTFWTPAGVFNTCYGRR